RMSPSRKPTKAPRLRDPIGERIAARRSTRGLTLAALALRVRAAPSHLCHIENGEKVPNEDLAARIARALGDDEQAYRAWSRGRLILTRRILPLRPDGLHAVRADERVELARLLWNGRELVVLPAPGESDFVVLPVPDEAALRAVVLGRVVLARAEE